MSEDSKKPVERNLLAKTSRRRKVFALKAEGKKVEEIAKALKISEKTVDRDLASPDAQAFIDALVDRQIVDIESVKKATVRLEWRSDLLNKLLPKRPSVEVNLSQTQNQAASRAPVIDLSKLSEDDRKALLHAEEALSRAEASASSQ
jgi:DNA-binding transcriptional ArsR family regulator